VLLAFVVVALLLVALARWQVRRSSNTAALPAQP
jgi:cytochrome oxidase assembly protein ShyY1